MLQGIAKEMLSQAEKLAARADLHAATHEDSLLCKRDENTSRDEIVH